MLFRSLERAEAFLLLGLAGCGIAHFLGVAGAITGIVITLGGLGAIFFLMAYRPPVGIPTEAPAEVSTEQKSGMPSLLMQTIFPKVLWISSAIGAAGLMIYFTNPGNDGFKQLLLIQSLTCGLCLVGMGLFTAQGIRGAKELFPVLFRAIPLTLASVQTLLA
jgi:hypothetical protein